MHDIGVATGRNVVVVIGIDRYAAWPHLGNAVNDARGTAAAFSNLGFTEINTLIDDGATGDAIRKLVTDDLAALAVNDSLVVFFAGHGGTKIQPLEDGARVKTGYIIPVDAEHKQGKASTWIRLDTWLADIARLPPKHILVILDACHSGIALDVLIRSPSATTWQGDAEHQLTRRRSRKLIVSALDNEVALDGGPRPGHSLFTGHLIEALTRGLPRDGRDAASGTELGVYLQTHVTRYPNARQTPSFGAFDLDDHGELMVPLLPASSSSPVQEPDADINAPLRARLAMVLADQCSSRASIAKLASAHSPHIHPADLPAGTAVMIWEYILVELTNAGAFSEISAIIDAVQNRSRRSRRVDWKAFSGLLQPLAVPAVASWSHATVELRRGDAEPNRDGDEPDRIDRPLIADVDTLLEAVVTQRWGGVRPPHPRIEVISEQLVFGTTMPLPHETTQLLSSELATARWLVRIRVPGARIRTRRVTVRCAGTRHMARRYVVSHKGSLCATSLWLACAAFAAYSLSPILPWPKLLPLISAGTAVGLLPSLGVLLSKLTGKHSFQRLFVAWELAAPLAVIATAIVFAVPPRFFVLTTNATKVRVPVGNGRIIEPDVTGQTMLESEVDTWRLEEPFCWCAGTGRCQPCDPDPPANVRGFRQRTLGCKAGSCDRLTQYLFATGAARISGPLGTKLSKIRFDRGSLSQRMTLKAGDIAVEAIDLPDSDTERTLEMLPGQTAYDLDFAPDGGHESLHCDKPADRIVRLTIDEPAATAEPAVEPPSASAPIRITIGETTSRWTGAAARLRACHFDADRSPPKLALVTPAGELNCHGGPVERVVMLDPPAPAGQLPRPPGKRAQLQITIGSVVSLWSPATGSRAVRACLGSPGDVEIAGLAQGAHVTLPRDLTFQQLRLRRPRGRAGDTVPVPCDPGDTLRIIALENVNARTQFRPGAASVALLGDTAGATCSAPGEVVQLLDGTPCQLKEDVLSCPAPRIRLPDCFYDKSYHSVDQILDNRKRAECPTRADGMDLSDARDIARDNHIACQDIYVCK